jgi:hypothetical protein
MPISGDYEIYLAKNDRSVIVSRVVSDSGSPCFCVKNCIVDFSLQKIVCKVMFFRELVHSERFGVQM